MTRLGSELQLALVGVRDSLFIAACWAVFCCCYFLSFCFGCCLHTRLSFLCLLLLLLALRLVCVINVQTSPARCTRNCGEKLKEKLSSCCVHIACKVIPTTLQKNKASSQHIVRSVGKARVGRKRLLPAHEAILAQRLVPNLHRLCGAVKKKKKTKRDRPSRLVRWECYMRWQQQTFLINICGRRAAQSLLLVLFLVDGKGKRKKALASIPAVILRVFFCSPGIDQGALFLFFVVQTCFFFLYMRRLQ